MRTTWRAVGAAALASALTAVIPSAAFAAEATPTFTKDVAPIFQDKCEACHRVDSIAPMSLVTYEEVRPWARSIKTRVSARQMPPWHIDKTVGIQQFKNDRSLNDEQIDTIVRWVDAGAPRGDAKDMPAAKVWPKEQGWNFAERLGVAGPDLIITSTPWTHKAGANDAWWKPVVDVPITEPKWVRAIEIRPGTIKGRKITHHAIARLQQQEPGDAALDPDEARRQAGTFMEWAVGKEGEMMRPNSGKLMLPGSRIVWDIHYSQGGEDVTDNVEMGLYFYPKGQEPKYRQTLHLWGTTRESSSGTDIPPNSVVVSQGFHVLQRAARIESFQPHMHLRGKAMSMEAILPNGQSQILSHADWDFLWHNTYQYADDAAPLLPKGTIVKVTAWHDNTAANKGNPDPNVWVGYGDRTVDEMAHAWVNVTYMSDEDYQAEVDARNARLQRNTQQQQQQ